MKDYFIVTLNDRPIEVRRVSSSNLATWYRILVTIDKKKVDFDMSKSSGGLWKIHTPRLPSIIYIIGNDLSDLLEENEKTEVSLNYQPKFCLDI